MPGPRKKPSAGDPSITYIREWREFRGLGLREMAKLLDMDPGYLSRVECGERRYNQTQLDAIAAVLRTSAVTLISRPPAPAEEEELWRMWDGLSDETRAAIRAMISAASASRKGDS